MAGQIVPIERQGVASMIGSNIYTPKANYYGNILNLKMNNTAATSYTISLYRANINGNRFLLYTMDLSSGDFVNDDTNYQIAANNSLYLISSVSTVQYIITGTEYQIA